MVQRVAQLSWLVGADGALLVDEVVRLEELRERWPPTLQKAICGLAGTSYAEATAPANARRNPVAASHTRTTRTWHYSLYYDEPTRHMGSSS